MKTAETVFCALLGIAIGVGIFHMMNMYFGLMDDNPIEQGIEQIIEFETGIPIDLTPEK